MSSADNPVLRRSIAFFSFGSKRNRKALTMKRRLLGEDHPEFAKVAPIFEAKCWNCHSSETEFPFYARLPLAAAVIQKDIKAGEEWRPAINGWCRSTRLCGSANLFPLVPPASSTAPIDAAWPSAMVATSGLTYCMVS